MKLNIKHVFDAPVDIVMRARRERFQHTDKIPGLKDPNYVSSEENDDTLTTVRKFQADQNVPGPVKKMLSPEMFHFTEYMTLHKADNKLVWRIESAAQKDKLQWKGVSHYKAAGDDKTERVIQAEVKVKVPFIGDTMEKTIASGFKKSMEKDFQTISKMAELILNGDV